MRRKHFLHLYPYAIETTSAVFVHQLDSPFRAISLFCEFSLQIEIAENLFN